MASVWSILMSKPKKKGVAKKTGARGKAKGNAWQNYVSGGKRR
jgi:hypothetical protein